jgi:hypothetical protein
MSSGLLQTCGVQEFLVFFVEERLALLKLAAVLGAR